MHIDIDKVKQWIYNRTQLQCPACEKRNFSIESKLAMTVTIDNETKRIDYLSGYPLIVVTCENCGYIIFLAPRRLE